MSIALVLRPSARPGGLLPYLKPLPAGWERGVHVLIDSLSSPHRMGPCASPDMTPRRKGDVAEFQPVNVIEGITCSLLGKPDTSAEAMAALEQAFDFVLSQELYDGAATGNPNLSDGQDLGNQVELRDAIGSLEEWADQRSHGLLAVLHVPVGLASSIRSYVTRGPDGLLHTTAGNLVAIHGQGTRVHITGELWGSKLVDDSRESIDYLINQSEGWAYGVGIVVFDPYVNAYVDVTGEISSPTSAGSPTSV